MKNLIACTLEQQNAVEPLTESSLVVFPDGEGCHIDDYITFDDMAAIVDYLRSKRPPLTWGKIEIKKGGAS